MTMLTTTLPILVLDSGVQNCRAVAFGSEAVAYGGEVVCVDGLLATDCMQDGGGQKATKAPDVSDATKEAEDSAEDSDAANQEAESRVDTEEADKEKAKKDAAAEAAKRRRIQKGLETVNKVLPQDGKGFTNDRAVLMLAEAQLGFLIKAGKATPIKQLREQLDRELCELSLLPESTTPIDAEALYVDRRKSVVAILASRKHDDHWHVVLTATGFMITADGALVTNHHVIRSESMSEDEYMFVMTSDGRVHPIESVLAGNRSNDAVICQVGGSGFHAVPLRADAPVGSSARVISHPKGRLYTVSEGMVSRRYARSKARRARGDKETIELDLSKTTNWLTVTADFGKGSSGAPIFDSFGNAIGVAALTSSVTVEKDDDAISQMVFRDCVPADVVLEMVTLVK